MIIRIDGAKEIREEWRAQGLTTTLDRPEDIATMIEVNKQMAEIRRDFILKNARSEESATQVVFTA